MENTQKSNIPLMIIGAFVSFAIFILYIVYQAFQVDVNLVRDDYYQNSTQHDAHVAEIKRSEDTQIKLFYDRNNEIVIFEVPEEFTNVNGEIHFYRPSDSKLDFKVTIVLNDNKQILSSKAIASGKWELKTVFSYNGQQYYKESEFVK